MSDKDQKIKELKDRLSKKDTSVLLQTLKEVKTEGNYSLIPYLIGILKDTNNPDVEKRVVDILNNINIQASAPFIAESIQKTKEKRLLEILISACWKNGLDYSDFIEVFIDKFLEMDFHIALEAFTVIENATSHVDQERTKKIIAYLKENHNQISNDKKPLFTELIFTLENRIINKI
jgi:hypothetical protein